MKECKKEHTSETRDSMDRAIKTGFLPYLKDIAVVLAVVLIVFLFCFRIAVVDGDSMNNTLINGDYVLLLNKVLAGDPKPGDIVVISTTYGNGKPIIKRVIATEGQEINIDFEKGIVTVDGKVLDEPYIKDLTQKGEGAFEYPMVVDEGCLFVMGDNRMNSTDSRSTLIGQIDCREVIGKAFFRIFPGNDDGNVARDFGKIGVIS